MFFENYPIRNRNIVILTCSNVIGQTFCAMLKNCVCEFPYQFLINRISELTWSAESIKTPVATKSYLNIVADHHGNGLPQCQCSLSERFCWKQTDFRNMTRTLSCCPQALLPRSQILRSQSVPADSKNIVLLIGVITNRALNYAPPQLTQY